MKKLAENIRTIGWSVKLALQINAGVFWLWGTLGIGLSVLPSIALYFNRRTVSILSAFLRTGTGTFGDVLPSVISLGIILTAVGLSKRVNGNFLYFIMYDSYYFGLEEYMMDVVKRIELKTLMDKKYRDEHWLSFSYEAHGCGFSSFCGSKDILGDICFFFPLYSRSVGA